MVSVISGAGSDVTRHVCSRLRICGPTRGGVRVSRADGSAKDATGDQRCVKRNRWKCHNADHREQTAKYGDGDGYWYELQDTHSNGILETRDDGPERRAVERGADRSGVSVDRECCWQHVVDRENRTDECEREECGEQSGQQAESPDQRFVAADQWREDKKAVVTGGCGPQCDPSADRERDEQIRGRDRSSLESGSRKRSPLAPVASLERRRLVVSGERRLKDANAVAREHERGDDEDGARTSRLPMSMRSRPGPRVGYERTAVADCIAVADPSQAGHIMLVAVLESTAYSSSSSQSSRNECACSKISRGPSCVTVFTACS